MPRFAPMLRLLLTAGVVLLGLSAAAQAPGQDLFPGYSAVASKDAFAGVAPVPMATAPLSTPPTVIALDHLEPAQMSDADHDVVSNLSPELSRAAALANFDISGAGWSYQQVACPAFPDYVFLAFSHGSDPNGSSHFVALLPRDSSQVRIVSTFAHGLLPFEASWNRPGTFEVFNGILRREQGTAPLSYAHNWLLIAVCYAELSGYPVQVLDASVPSTDLTMDLLRLDANQPQLRIGADQTAEVTFSDVSRPTLTTNWTVHFDRRGQITSAGRTISRQTSTIALKP